MDETKNVNPNDESKEAKKNGKTGENQFTAFVKKKYGEFKGEFTKIIWPSRKDLFKESVTVIITSLIFGAVICAMDWVFSNGYTLLVDYVSKLG